MTMAAPKYQVIERESLDGMLYLPGKASVITHFMPDDEIVALGDLMAAAFGKGETSDFDIAVNGCRVRRNPLKLELC